jgi:uncharacterized BrkB/YihY/UPF0761 family membrane protein
MATPAEPPAPAELPTPAEEGKAKSAITRGRERVDEFVRDVEASRERVRSVDVALSAAERDRTAGGPLLAGALAFRAFLWLLPAALTVVLLLGITASSTDTEPADVVHDAGLPGLVTSSVAEAANQDDRGRIVGIVLSLIFLWMASGSLLKVVRAVHSFAWGVPLQKPKSRSKATAVLIAILLGLVVLAALASVIRDASPGPGIAATGSLFIAFAGAYWLTAWLSPHGNAPLLALLPGAILFGAGIQAMHIVSVVYLGPKVASSSQLYGALGAAAVLLLWLYLLSRLLVASAVLNAAMWTRRTSAPVRDAASILAEAEQAAREHGAE